MDESGEFDDGWNFVEDSDVENCEVIQTVAQLLHVSPDGSFYWSAHCKHVGTEFETTTFSKDDLKEIEEKLKGAKCIS